MLSYMKTGDLFLSRCWAALLEIEERLVRGGQPVDISNPTLESRCLIEAGMLRYLYTLNGLYDYPMYELTDYGWKTAHNLRRFVSDKTHKREDFRASTQ